MKIEHRRNEEDSIMSEIEEIPKELRNRTNFQASLYSELFITVSQNPSNEQKLVIMPEVSSIETNIKLNSWMNFESSRAFKSFDS